MKHYLKYLGPALLVIGLILMLTGCTTLEIARSRICDNREVVREQIERQIEAAADISDPAKRAGALAGLALTLAVLEKCP